MIGIIVVLIIIIIAFLIIVPDHGKSYLAKLQALPQKIRDMHKERSTGDGWTQIQITETQMVDEIQTLYANVQAQNPAITKVVIAFMSNSCHYCTLLAPIWLSVADSNTDPTLMFKDFIPNSTLITAFPTIMKYDGTSLYKFAGARTKANITAFSKA